MTIEHLIQDYLWHIAKVAQEYYWWQCDMCLYQPIDIEL